MQESGALAWALLYIRHTTGPHAAFSALWPLWGRSCPQERDVSTPLQRKELEAGCPPVNQQPPLRAQLGETEEGHR